MPRYDYICKNDKCDKKTFEVLKSNFEDTWEHCPNCKEKTKDKKSVYQYSFNISI